MSAFSSRILAVLILACWMIPSVDTLGVGLHMNLHHPQVEAHRDFHQGTATDLSTSQPHHHHDEASSDHGHHHGAVAVAPALRSNFGLSMVLPAPTSAAVVASARQVLECAPRRAQTVSLFTAHCSLLL